MWMTLAAVVVAGALVSVLVVTLRRESTFNEATERVLQSSLLPDDWSTYGADVWSVGYPNTWEIDSDLLGADAALVMQRLHFYPIDADEGDVYFQVEKEALTLEEVATAFSEKAGVTRSEFRFAGYPAVKFSTYRRDEYYISYGDGLYRIVTDYPKSDEIGIMLATFKFID